MPVALAVSVGFAVKDGGVRAFFDRASAGADKFKAASTGAFGAATKSSQSFIGMAAKGIIVYRTLGAIGNAAGKAGTEWLDFEQSMRLAIVQFDDIRSVGLHTAAGIEKIGLATQKALQFSQEFGVSSAMTAKTLAEIGKAGLNSEQAFASLGSIFKVVKLEGGDANVTAQKLLQSLSTFKLASKNPLEFGENFKRMSDMIYTANVLSLASVDSLVEAITSGGGAAMMTALKQPPEIFLGMASVLADVGLQGEEIGTVIRNIMTHFAGATKEQRDLMGVLNLEMRDATGKMKDPIGLLSEVIKKTERLDVWDMAAVFSTLFGLRATGATLNLTGALGKLNANIHKIKTSSGELDTQFDYVTQSMQFKFDRLGVAADQAGGRFLDAFGVKGKGAIDRFTDALNSWNPAPFAAGVMLIVDNIKLLTWVFGGFVAAWTVAKISAMTFAAIEFASAFLLIAKMQGIATAATVMFNAALWMNPITWIVAGVAALVAGLVYLETEFGLVSGLASAFWETLKGVTKVLFTEIPPFSWLWTLLEYVGARAGTLPGGGMPGGAEEALGPVNPQPAPNAARVALQRQEWRGYLDINGLPAGSQFRQAATGGSSMEMNLGYNP